ncbi:MAG: hypothetical protein NWE98_08115 [Candidatus Bathyarchaeota archaeon]|nr:hypothetical protein [Candidatus Bathyarchaeota archaeon]
MKFSIKTILLLTLLGFAFIFTAALARAQNSNLTGVTSPTTVNLNGVAIVNNLTTTPSGDLTKLDAWAVGDGGTIIHWNGNAWTTVNSPTTMNLYSTVFTNATDGWAVGGNGNNGIILRYNGTWTIWNHISFGNNASATDTVNATLYSVTVDSTDTVGWAVGANGLALGWNGEAWFGFQNIAPNNLRSVSMAHNSANAWAVGDGGTIVMWDGTKWSAMTSPTFAPLYAIEMINATSGWAGGGTDTNGIILTLNGTTWTVQNRINYGGATNTTAGGPTDIINATIYSISMNTPTSAWAVGSKGNVLYWDGNEWAGQANVESGANLRSVSMVHGVETSTQAWAVGQSGKILAWTGTNWVPELPMIAVPLLLVVGVVAALLSKFARTKRFHPRSMLS